MATISSSRPTSYLGGSQCGSLMTADTKSGESRPRKSPWKYDKVKNTYVRAVVVEDEDDGAKVQPKKERIRPNGVHKVPTTQEIMPPNKQMKRTTMVVELLRVETQLAALRSEEQPKVQPANSTRIRPLKIAGEDDNAEEDTTETTIRKEILGGRIAACRIRIG
jgi:hypothetical protein